MKSKVVGFTTLWPFGIDPPPVSFKVYKLVAQELSNIISDQFQFDHLVIEVIASKKALSVEVDISEIWRVDELAYQVTIPEPKALSGKAAALDIVNCLMVGVNKISLVNKTIFAEKASTLDELLRKIEIEVSNNFDQYLYVDPYK